MKDESEEISSSPGIQDSLQSGVSALGEAARSFHTSLLLTWQSIVQRWRSTSELSKAIITLLVGALIGPFVRNTVVSVTIPSLQQPTIADLLPNFPEYFLPVNAALWFLTLMILLNTPELQSSRIRLLEEQIEELEEQIENLEEELE